MAPGPRPDPGPSPGGLDAELAAAVLDAAALLVVVLDPRARILRFNGACEQLTGFRAEEVVGQPVWRFVPEDQRPEVEGIFEELSEGRANLHENDWITRDGGRRCIAWSNVAIRDASGAVTQVIGTGIDVSALRASEARRRESQSRLEEVLHAAMDAILCVDEGQGTISLFNPAAERMFGRPATEVVGRPLDVLLPGRFRDSHHEHVRRFARSGETSRRMGQLGQVWGLRADGEEFPIEASISQTRGPHGTLLTVILRDVSERERAAETERLLASIVRGSDDAIVASDLEGRILSWNPAAERIYGCSQAEAMRVDLAMLVAPEHQPQLEAVLKRVREGESVGHLETVGLRKDGHRFEASLGVSPYRDGSGTIVGASLIVRDVSEQQELERRLRQTQELASLGTLVAGIAHDIGTPMNVILGYTDMLAGSLREEKDRERLGIVREQVARVVRLIETLLNFAHPQRQPTSPVQVEAILERALSLLSETLRRRGIEVERAFEGVAPVVGEAERLERAFLNLLVNACDAMADGGVLRLSTREHEQEIEVRIADTGGGIAPEALERIFEPFYTTKGRQGGSGLGLLVTRGIVVEHGGAIDVRSEVGRGSEFRLRLPRRGPGAGTATGHPPA